jgi:septal ring factor EnvC (AmiA/AmiB activator)
MANKQKTKSLRSAYNSALLRANIQPQELKDILMGHKRLGARSHYAYDKITILEAYEKAFKYLSINHGTQARKDLERIENSLIGLSQTVAKEQATINKLQTQMDSLNEALRESPYLIMRTETPNGKETYTLIKSEKLDKKTALRYIKGKRKP